MGKKKINIGLILIIISIILISSGGILLTQSDMFKDNNNENNTNNTNSNTEITDKELSSKISGLYSNDEVKIKIYSLSENSVFYLIEGKSYYQGVAKIENKIASSDLFDFTLNLNTNSIKLISKEKDYNIESGEYNRVGDYNSSDFYSDNIGDPDYISSNISGNYKIENKDVKMTVIQISNDTIEITITDEEYNFFSIYLNKESENSDIYVTNDDYLDDSKCKATFSDNKIDLIIENEVFNMFNGNYVKESSLKIEEIIKQKYN